MACGTQPIFPSSVNFGRAQISAANTNRDGTTGIYVLLWTAGANGGGRIDLIRATATGTTTAGMVRLFQTDTAGANKFLFDEIPVTAIAPSGTVQAFTGQWNLTIPLVLKAGQQIWASTHNAETFNVEVHGGDY